MKRGEPALMTARARAIDPGRRRIIAGIEMEQPPLSRVQPGRTDESTVPAGLEETAVVDSAPWCLRCKGHDNATGPFDLRRLPPPCLTIDGKVPGAVQAPPFFSPELRSWIPD